MKKRIFNMASLLLLFLFLLSSGCATRIVPKPLQPGDVDLSSNIITKEKDGIRISVQSMEWSYYPYNLDDFYTPMLLLIRNNTDKNINFKITDLVLVDEKGNQFNAADPSIVERIMAPRGYGQGPYPPPFFYGGYLPPPGIGYYPFIPSDITLLSISEGNILPGAQVRGFIYFKRVAAYGKNLKLKANIDGMSEEFEFEIR